VYDFWTVFVMQVSHADSTYPPRIYLNLNATSNSSVYPIIHISIRLVHHFYSKLLVKLKSTYYYYYYYCLNIILSSNLQAFIKLIKHAKRRTLMWTRCDTCVNKSNSSKRWKLKLVVSLQYNNIRDDCSIVCRREYPILYCYIDL
jgi:hypothetical protein